MFAAGNKSGGFRHFVKLRRIYENTDSDFNNNDFRRFSRRLRGRTSGGDESSGDECKRGGKRRFDEEYRDFAG
ncbi:MAG: hypothetical protein WKF71_09495 [Pyrinomonadaceae bacterium]